MHSVAQVDLQRHRSIRRHGLEDRRTPVRPNEQLTVGCQPMIAQRDPALLCGDPGLAEIGDPTLSMASAAPAPTFTGVSKCSAHQYRHPAGPRLAQARTARHDRTIWCADKFREWADHFIFEELVMIARDVWIPTPAGKNFRQPSWATETVASG